VIVVVVGSGVRHGGDDHPNGVTVDFVQFHTLLLQDGFE
jgi:hypothetical protein